LIAVTAAAPGIRLDIRYATSHNFTGQAVYPAAEAYLRRPVAEKRRRSRRKLETQNLGLKVFDAYRPLAVQKRSGDYARRALRRDPQKGSRHNRGSAVDVTLVRRDTGIELPMPTPYDDFTEKAGWAYTNFPPEVLRNRELLREVMTRHGFLPFPTEWWHYDDAAWTNYSTWISFQRSECRPVPGAAAP
jgi:D-alanyl-D-alanine dipeptidase